MGLPVAADYTSSKNALNTTATAVLKGGPGFLFSAGAGAAAIDLYDSADVTGGAVAANHIWTVAISSYVQLNIPFNKGLLVTGAGPGTVSFE
jgi:hypothetical protein